MLPFLQVSSEQRESGDGAKASIVSQPQSRWIDGERGKNKKTQPRPPKTQLFSLSRARARALYLARSLSLARARALSLSRSLSLSRARALSLSLSLSLSLCLSLCLSLSNPITTAAITHARQRAEEIEKVEPKVAYYCRMYAVEQGLALRNRSPQIDGLLGALLSKLEKDKPELKPPPPGSDDAAYCERFALSVFARADRVDRAGRADKSTSTAFYAASVFMEILNQFGPLAADVAEAQRYSAWKAADIRKALREGRRPLAGPPPGKGGSGGDGAVEGGGGGDLLDLPSPSPPAPARASDPAAAAAAPPPPPPAAAPLAPPRFVPGARVLYCHDGHGPGVPGTVAKNLPPEGLGHAFVVALAGQVVSAFEPQLSPALEVGDDVVVRAKSELEDEKGESAKEIADVAKLASEDASKKKGVAGLFSKSESKSGKDDGDCDGPEGRGRAVVVAVDASGWRPRLTVRLVEEGDGREITVTDRRLSSFPLPSASGGGSSAAAALPPPKVPKGDPPPFAAAHAPPAPPPAAVAHAAAAAAAPSAPPPASSSSASASSFAPSLQQITEAVKAAKYAVSSLQFEDVGTGVKFLREALELLTTEPTKGGGGGKKK